MRRPAEIEDLLRKAAPRVLAAVVRLIQVASRRMIDRIRRESARRGREDAAASDLAEPAAAFS